MMKCAVVYERQGRVFIRTSSRTTAGAWVETGPCTMLNAGAGAKAIGEAVIDHLEMSVAVTLHPTDFKALAAPLLEAAGVKRWSTFGKSARCVLIERRTDTLVVEPTVNRRPGFVVLEGGIVSLDAGAAPAAIGAAVLAAIDASS